MGQLLYCPMCRQQWPRGADYDLRGFGWLENLPRAIGPSNLDAIIHVDGIGDRFLILETKGAEEQWQAGQLRLFRALARLPAVDVFVLRGSLQDLTIARIAPAGALEAWPISAGAARAFVVAWIEDGQATPLFLSSCGVGQEEACLKLRDHGGPHRSATMVWPQNGPPWLR